MVYIDDVNFDEMTDDQWMEIGKVHMANLVTIIRDCNVDPRNVVGLVSQWGPLRYSGMLNICSQYPDIPAKELIARALKNDPAIDPQHCDAIRQRFKTKGPAGTQRVTDIKDKNGDYTGIFPDGELKWHSNEAGNHVFAPGVALLGSENMIGSSTGFVQTATYYEDVSESFRSELDEMVVIHRHKPGMLHVKDLGDQDEIMRINMNPEEESYIPMVIQSPGGIKGLHYSINTVDGIVGMSKAESDALFERMNKELMVERYMTDHWYKNNNDWLFFDNSITNHRRLGDVPGRLAFRVQHGYDHIQVPDYNPYYQEEHAKIYSDKLAELNSFMESNFGN
jgi:alpha-ketoglutarate-dependent taurine dioxygenase